MQVITIPQRTLLRPMAIIGCFFAGFLIFIIELNSQHILAALYRNIVFAIIAYILFLTLNERLNTSLKNFRVDTKEALKLLGSLGLVTMLTTSLINAITFQLFPVPGPYSIRWFFEGVMLHLAVYSVWVIIQATIPKHWLSSHALVESSETETSSNTEDKVAYADRFIVDSGKSLTLVKASEISHFKADGDYIRLHTGLKSHLIRKKVRDLEKELDPNCFQRVHRSFIVNIHFVSALRPVTNGDYCIVLSNGHEVKMSRSYKHVIKSHLGEVL